ncbi:MAG: amidohydrolase [Bacteroidales bacterium]|nr:amidohydrolase [Bacteroidales bacterium]
MTNNLKVTTIQTNLIWEDVKRNLLNFELKIRNIGEITDIIVLPEMFSTGFSMKPAEFAESMDGESAGWMKKMATLTDALIVGSLIIKENGKFVNRLLAVKPDGAMEYYDKRHLFAIGGEHKEYDAGNKLLIFSYKGWKINPLICYDLRFPVWSRNQNDFDIQIYVANWPEKRSFHWNILLQARAIENQSFVVGVNRIGADGNGYLHSGDTCIFDPMGIRISKTNPNEDSTETVTLDKSLLEQVRKSLPFLQDGDNFTIA